jgi:hypothetical protein
MREITMPEVKLPDIKLPEGLRDMTRDDIVQAAHDAGLPSMTMPKRIEMPDFDLSKLELPKQLADRLPRRGRRNRLLPIAAVVAIGAMIAGVWWLFTSSITGPRVHATVKDIRQRVTGEVTDVARYDNEDNLTSLLTDAGEGRVAMGSEPYASTADTADLSNGVPVGPGTAPEAAGRSV